MKKGFSQKDYVLHLTAYVGVLKYFKQELAEIEKSGKKTLWYFGAKKTFKHLKEEKGKNLLPRDVDNIVYALLAQIKEKQKKV